MPITEDQHDSIVERVRLAIPDAQEVVFCPENPGSDRWLLSVKHPTGRSGLWMRVSEADADEVVVEMVRTYYKDVAGAKYRAKLEDMEDEYKRLQAIADEQIQAAVKRIRDTGKE